MNNNNWISASNGLPEPETGEKFTVRTNDEKTYEGYFQDWGFTIGEGGDKFIDCSRIEAYKPIVISTDHMEDMIELSADQLFSDLSELDCGDNSCHFMGRGKGGMRTNGGCRCLRNIDRHTRMVLIKFYHIIKSHEQ